MSAIIKVKNITGQVVVEQMTDVFVLPMNEKLIKEVFLWQMNCRRTCCAHTKTRGEVNYSNRKMRPQKGSGRARMGDKGAPHHRKGGIAHGPNDRQYRYSLPKNKKFLALNIVISDLIRNNNLVLVDSLRLEAIKTKQFLLMKNNLALNNKCLFVDSDKNEILHLSLRNTINNFLPVIGLNIASILQHTTLVMSLEAFKQLEARYA